MERWLRGKQRNNCWNKCFFFFFFPPLLFLNVYHVCTWAQNRRCRCYECVNVCTRALLHHSHTSVLVLLLSKTCLLWGKSRALHKMPKCWRQVFFFSFSLFSLEQRCLTKKTKQNWICDLFDHSVSDFMQMNKRVMTNQISLTLYSCLVSILVHNKKIKAVICNFCTCWCLQGELQLWWWQTKPVYWNYIFYVSKGKGVGLISGSKNIVCTI